MDSDVKIDGDGCNIFEENKTFDKVIVMDDLSNLADKSDDFANFLMVSQKFGYIFFLSSILFIQQNQYSR